VINSGRDVFPGHADLWLQPREGTEGTLIDGLINRLTSGTYKIEGICETTELELEKVEKGIAMYGEAQRPVIIYGDGIVQQGEPTIITSLLRLSAIKGETADGRLRIISLKSNANSRGAWDLGLASGFLAKDVKGVYVLLGDDELKDERLLTQLKGVDSLVVQASFHSSLTAMAQVVLPSPIWGEREGEHVTMDGQAHRSQRALDPPKGVKGDEEILAELTKRLTTR
jgi:predicted molibdopterin-dependent oxidoreductase YjgC